jgi:hypothetical protein
MPTPTIPAGNLFMNATLWTGTGNTANTITNGVAGQSFQPDFVWAKSRSDAYDHVLYDSVRGTGTTKSLASSNTQAEGYNSAYNNLSAFNSNGFSIGTTSLTNTLNNSGSTFVAWQWKANGTAVTNTAGTISSQVSSNPTSGFSVVTYTGNTINGATVGHGLLVGGVATAPRMIIVKNRSTSTLWAVYHASVGAASVAHLDDPAGFSASGDWNSVTPTPTVFTVGTSNRVNNANNYVAYCFAPVAGYSAFGSYTANGVTDGPFIYTGFRPRFVMTKKSSSSGAWAIVDTSIIPYNQETTYLQPNTSGSVVGGTASNGMDINSNGFKIRSTDASFNETAGDTYIYACFAENPFKYANAR